MIRIGLGDAQPAAPTCSAGFYPPPARCPNYDEFKIVSDASGCQRCEKKSPAEMSSTYCVQALQFYLQNQGQLTVADATGQWNDASRRAMVLRFGPSWENYPGGACGLLASIGVGVVKPGQGYNPYGAGYGPGQYPYGYQPTFWTTQNLLLLGGAAAVVLLLVRRSS
jgi:hypothetical protein